MHFSFDINWVVWCRGYLYYFLRKLNRKIWIGYPIYRQWVTDPVGESVCLSELGFCSIYIFTVRCHSVQATLLELWISSIWQISITSSCFPPTYHDVDKDSDICTILVQRNPSTIVSELDNRRYWFVSEGWGLVQQHPQICVFY